MLLKSRVNESLEVLRHTIDRTPVVAIVLGSGLGDVADRVEHPLIIPTGDIPNYPVSTVPGHQGRWVYGEINAIPVVCIQGRVHYYEGYSLEAVTYYVHLVASLGIQNLLLTTACGALNPAFKAGDLMLITDQLNLTCHNPLVGKPDNQLGRRFPDMSQPFDPDLLRIAERVGNRLQLPFQKGVFCWVTGPNYETAAEVRAFRRLGGDAVSMSTAPEVIVARQRRMKVLGISMITNPGTGLTTETLSHKDVTAKANMAGEQLGGFIQEFVATLGTAASE